MNINGFWELLYRSTDEEKETIIAYMGEGIKKGLDDEKKTGYIRSQEPGLNL